MDRFLKWIQVAVSRRGFIGGMTMGVCHFAFKGIGWAGAEYRRVKTFLIRSIEETPPIDLGSWRLRIEGLVEGPLTLRFEDIQALPRKVQTKNFVCVEGWGLESQEWEGVHLQEILSKAKMNPKAKFVSFYATGGKYLDSLSIQEALEPDTMLAFKVNGKDLLPENGFPLRLVVPRMYAYKSVKWVERIVLTEKQEVGYWERFGYSSDASIRGLER
ncbi:MAG TPA: molybdopterin-dependent oxidoreductase [Thermodesulfobacteriota bacterium]|nr:molybdopterin-dependent oxidoreductase [Thermodesulfobacteriota bacterium]